MDTWEGRDEYEVVEDDAPAEAIELAGGLGADLPEADAIDQQLEAGFDDEDR